MGKFDMAAEVWSVVRPFIDPQYRQEVAKAVIDATEGLENCRQLKEDLETDPSDVVDDWAPEDSCGDLDDDGFYDNDQYDPDYEVPFDRRS